MIFSSFSYLELWLILSLLFIIRYSFVSGVSYYFFYALKKKKLLRYKIQKKFPGTDQLKKELKYSAFTLFIYTSGILLYIFWTSRGYTRMYNEFSEYGTGYFIFSILIMLLLHDTYFYWTHRLIHHSRLFRHIHRVHHTFTAPTPFSAFAFHPLEAVISMGIIPLIIFLIPYHQFALVVFISIMSLYNIYIHLGYRMPGWIYLNWQNSSRAHDLHHQKGKGNYGLYFNLWDRLMGTYVR